MDNEVRFTDLSCRDFTEKLSSKAPVPGGGGAAALCGALGAALCDMVGNLTVGKKKYKDVEEEIIGLMDRITALMHDLEDLVEEDAKSFEPLSRAYSLPKSTPEEQAEKDRVMEECLKVAVDTPMQIMRKITEVISMIRVFKEKGSTLAVSDAGCAAALSSAALKAASLNVFINTGAMKDKEYAAGLSKEAEDMLNTYVPMADQIYSEVLEKLMKK